MQSDDPRTDEELAAECQEGSLEAFEELFRRYQRPILAYIYQITRDYEDSACIAQDAFEGFYQGRQL